MRAYTHGCWAMSQLNIFYSKKLSQVFLVLLTGFERRVSLGLESDALPIEPPALRLPKMFTFFLNVLSKLGSITITDADERGNVETSNVLRNDTRSSKVKNNVCCLIYS